MTPEVSIIVPVCHGGVFLEQALDSLFQLKDDAVAYEVLAAHEAGDASSTFSIRRAAAKGLPVRAVETVGQDQTAKLNAACAEARGRILAFTDDDCRMRPGWLSRITQGLENNPGTGVLGGRDTLITTGKDFDLALDHVLNSPLGTGGMRGGASVPAGRYYPRVWNMACRTQDLRELSGASGGRLTPFRTQLPVHADVDLAVRLERHLGKGPAYDPEMVVDHYRDTTFGSFVARNYLMGGMSRRLGVHHPAHWLLSIFLLSVIVLGVLSVWFSLAVPLLWALLAGYGLYLLVAAAEGGLTMRRPKAALWIPVLLVGLHLSRAVGFALARAARNHGRANMTA